MKLKILHRFSSKNWQSVMVRCRQSRAVITRNIDGIITVHNYGPPDNNSVIGGAYADIDAALEMYSQLPHVQAMIRTIETT